MRIKIESDGAGTGTKIHHEDGTEIRGVSRIDLRIEAGAPNQAIVRFCIPTVTAFAEARMLPEHLRELAEAHGYDLVPRA